MNYDLIKIISTRRNITTSELCKAIKFTESGFYRMIKNCTMTIETLENICAVLKISPCIFFKENAVEDIVNEPEVDYVPKKATTIKNNELENLLRFKVKTLEARIKELEKTPT